MESLYELNKIAVTEVPKKWLLSSVGLLIGPSNKLGNPVDGRDWMRKIGSLVFCVWF